jgi:hypothetical protein
VIDFEDGTVKCLVPLYIGGVQEVAMDSVRLLETVRIGQLTGSTDLDASHPNWPLTVDAEQWPLLTDTGTWGAAGIDLGANTEHNGRTYIFFGDVATTSWSGIPLNADMVAWIDDPGSFIMEAILRSDGTSFCR